MPINKESHHFFAGFLIGEGSLNVSTKKTVSSRFGIKLDSEFSVTQHINGILHLHSALKILQGQFDTNLGAMPPLFLEFTTRDHW